MEFKIFRNKILCSALFFGFSFVGFNTMCSQVKNPNFAFSTVSASLVVNNAAGVAIGADSGKLATSVEGLYKTILAYKQVIADAATNCDTKSAIDTSALFPSKPTYLYSTNDFSFGLDKNWVEKKYYPILSAVGALDMVAQRLQDDISNYEGGTQIADILNDTNSRTYDYIVKGVEKGEFFNFANGRGSFSPLSAGNADRDDVIKTLGEIKGDPTKITALSQASMSPRVQQNQENYAKKNIVELVYIINAMGGCDKIVEPYVDISENYGSKAKIGKWIDVDKYLNTDLPAVIKNDITDKYDTELFTPDIANTNNLTQADFKKYIEGKVKLIRGEFAKLVTAFNTEAQKEKEIKDDTKFVATYDEDTGDLSFPDLTSIDKKYKFTHDAYAYHASSNSTNSLIRAYFGTESAIWNFFADLNTKLQAFLNAMITTDLYKDDLKNILNTKYLSDLDANDLMIEDSKSEFIVALRRISNFVRVCGAYFSIDSYTKLGTVNINDGSVSGSSKGDVIPYIDLELYPSKYLDSQDWPTNLYDDHYARLEKVDKKYVEDLKKLYKAKTEDNDKTIATALAGISIQLCALIDKNTGSGSFTNPADLSNFYSALISLFELSELKTEVSSKAATDTKFKNIITTTYKGKPGSFYSDYLSYIEVVLNALTNMSNAATLSGFLQGASAGVYQNELVKKTVNGVLNPKLRDSIDTICDVLQLDKGGSGDLFAPDNAVINTLLGSLPGTTV